MSNTFKFMPLYARIAFGASAVTMVGVSILNPTLTPAALLITAMCTWCIFKR